MHPLPNATQFAGLLAPLALDLQRGVCCLVIADKGWTHRLFHDLRDRLRAANLECDYIDGRPHAGDSLPEDVGVMLTAITQLRRAVRGVPMRRVVVLPHLDVMASQEGGWNSISRELVPLLYEHPFVILLGFQDPTLPVLPIVEKLFHRTYRLADPFRPVVASETVAEPDAQNTAEPPENTKMSVDPAPDFPKPQWPPIQALESVDLAGKRKDGGVDLVIVVSQPLDGSAETLAAIRQKIAYYLDVIDLPEFQTNMGHPPRERTSIILTCDFPIHPWARAVISEYQAVASVRGVRVILKQQPDSTPTQ